MRTQSQPRNSLTTLRLSLKRLEQIGDFSSPSLAELRRVLLGRKKDLEARERLTAKSDKALSRRRKRFVVTNAGPWIRRHSFVLRAKVFFERKEESGMRSTRTMAECLLKE
jgi:hypothetical protein